MQRRPRRKLRVALPQAAGPFGIRPAPVSVAAARAAGAVALHPHWAHVTPDLVQTAHAAGLAVSPWCPNDAPTIKWLADMGVDSIGTDYPELFDQI